MRAALRVPLFYKILIANVAIVLTGAIGGTVLTRALVRSDPARSPLELVLFFGLAGVMLSIAVNVVILWLALRPLQDIERAARDVQAGRRDARVPHSALADRDLERLGRTLNEMLDAGARDRQRVREMAARALHAAEEERKRISRELHDDTAQTLSALMVRLRVARDLTDRERQERRMEEIRVELARAAESVRRFARALRPAALDELGVAAAIREHARSLCEASGIAVNVEVQPLGNALDGDSELALYRIVQEALSNVVRHSEARRADVRITLEGEHVAAVVQDDGRGFATHPGGDLPVEPGLGIFGMRERAGYLGGSVTVVGGRNTGTTVRVQLPIRKRET